MRIFKVPAALYYVFNRFTWRMPVKDKSIFITFDDGPTQGITEWILEILDKYHAKATFFCVGENVVKHPELFNKIRKAGHSVGNHTHNHLNSREYSHESYILNIQQAAEFIPSPLFRPPYGRIRPRLTKKIRNAGFKPVMWSILSYDYDTEISPGFIFRKIVKQTQPGSIIVFHDNARAYKNLQILLPRYLSFFSNKGYKFKPLPETRKYL